MPKTQFDYEPRTQKAAGVLTLAQHNWHSPYTKLIGNEKELPEAWSLALFYGGGGGIFARPCPVRPRHGFVDSRRVNSLEEVQEIFQLAKENDPDAELLLCQAIPAQWNAIWVPGSIVIGPGNDGATSGHNSFTIPLVAPGQYTLNYMKELMDQARIKAPDVPYIEIVTDNEVQPYFTQIRGGPAVATQGPDYIPEKFTVTMVVEASGDLLEWETTARTLQPGTAVWHPGGSMASHYAVHCVLNKIPIITSKRPQVGDILAPTKSLPPVDMRAVLRGIASATYVPLGSNQRRAAVAALLTGLHNVTAFSDQSGFWLGAGAVLMQRLGSAALLGEARHATYREGRGRDLIYKRGLEDLFQTRRRIKRALWMFRNHPWRGGFGGNAWANCGDALFSLDDSIRKFVSLPREKYYKNMIASLNMAVNQAHNGGWWLNKFCEGDLMDKAARGDPRAVAGGVTVLGNLTQVPKPKRDEALAFWSITRSIPMPKRVRKTAKAKINKEPLEVLSAHAKWVVEDEHEWIHIQFKTNHHINQPYSTMNIESIGGILHNIYGHGSTSPTLRECFDRAPITFSFNGGTTIYHEITGLVNNSSIYFYMRGCETSLGTFDLNNNVIQ